MPEGPQPLYLGRDRAIARTRAGEFLCVDTNSIEALSYILDVHYEQDVMAVFRRFLTPNSVVLDIGAHFGIYTAAAGCIRAGTGRIISFEGNPHTFDYLRRTAYANKLMEHPRVQLVNALVGAAPGEAVIDYLPELLGRARIGGRARWGDRAISVTAPMVTVDDTLPADLAVDLVKIDVEGHEPQVMQGMRRTIARSPGMRIILEFVPRRLDRAQGARRFLDEIAALGFAACRIGPGGRLAALAPGEVPGGSEFNDMLFLTRHPEADLARRHIEIPATTLHVAPMPGMDQARLLAGSLTFEAGDAPPPPGAVLFYGPYINLRDGRYSLRLLGTLEGALQLKVAQDFGRAIAETTLDGTDTGFSFTLDRFVEHFEVIGYHTESLRQLSLAGIALEPL